MYKNKLFFVLFFIGLYVVSHAQKLKFDNYTSKDGLISDDVYKIFQDQKGYKWVFTDYGVMKYNGKKFEQTLKNLPFEESFIYSYFQNNKGQIWVANSNAKIYEIKNDSAFIIKGTEKLSKELKKNIAEITQLYVDDTLNIYAVTKLYTCKFSKKNNYRGEKIGYEFNSDTIACHAVCFNNIFLPEYMDYKGRHLGPYFLNHKTIKVKIKYCDTREEIFNIASSVLTSPKYFKQFGDDIYICFYNKLIKISKDKSMKEIFLNSIINDFIKDKDGRLWVACVNNGLVEIDQHDSIVNHYLTDKTVNDVLIDSQNGIWASTEGFGLFHCKGLNTYYYDKTEPLGFPISFIKKIEDKIFICNDQGDLFIVKNGSLIKIKKSNDIFSKPIDIIKYHSLYLISYMDKTEYFDLEKGIVKILVPLQKAFYVSYRSAFIDKDTLWSVRRNGLVKVCKDSILQKIEFNFKVFDCINRDKKIIIATDEGLYEYYNNKLVRPDHFKITEKCILSKIVKGKFGDLWFCSKGYGLFKLTSNNELKHYTVNNGLPSNIINDINFDTDYSVLLSTNIGLFYRSKYKKWMQIYKEQVESAIQYKEDVYFSTQNGLIIFKDIKPNEKYPIYFNLASVLVNSKLINLSQIEKLKYNQNNLEFNFDLISFSSGVSDISYQLNGSTTNSGITKNQQIVFQNLLPGSYTLTASLIKNYNKSGPIIIPFVIIPAFWQTNWFIIICVLCGVLICMYVGWSVLKFLKNKEQKKNETSRLITEYKLIALKAQINPHFMSNSLTAIQHLIFNNKVHEANEYLAKFSLLVRQVLNFSSKPLVTLKEELEIAAINIELEQLRFEHKFTYEIIYKEDFNFYTVFVPPLILQPIIENAIWHGLLPLKKIRTGKLQIEIQLKEKSLYIYIEDNGVGRKTVNPSMGNLKESKGIDITRQRIHNLNVYNNETIADLIYEDLTDNQSNAVGTRVIVILPLMSDEK